MNKGIRQPDKELRLEQAKKEFETLLRACLPECARGRWGLFGQRERMHGEEFAKRYYSWPEADKIVELAEEIDMLRRSLKDSSPFPLLEKFLDLRSLVGPGVLTEPKLALQFLQQLKREELAGQMPSDRAFWT
jgi:hypothetical protein